MGGWSQGSVAPPEDLGGTAGEVTVVSFSFQTGSLHLLSTFVLFPESSLSQIVDGKNLERFLNQNHSLTGQIHIFRSCQSLFCVGFTCGRVFFFF